MATEMRWDDASSTSPKQPTSGCATFFKKRDSHLISSGDVNTQLDYVLTRCRMFKDVLDTKVVPFECVTPQHKLLVADIRFKAAGGDRPVNRVAHIKWRGLKENNDRFHAAIDYPEVGPDPEETWTIMHENVIKVATEMLGVCRPGQSQFDKMAWLWVEDVQKAVGHKKLAYTKWRADKTEDNLTAYHQARSDAKKAVAAAKSAYYNELVHNLDSDPKCIYQFARARARAAKDIEPQYKCIRDHDGRRLFNCRDILRRWREHFGAISSEEFPHPPIPDGAPTDGLKQTFKFEEVTKEINDMKSNKAVGPDDIPAEFWKSSPRGSQTSSTPS